MGRLVNRSSLLVFGRGALAGLLLAASVPPWGWWPLAFVGIALLDRLVADQPAIVRFRRTWLVCAFWLYPAMLWMFDLTPPGYVIAGGAYAAYFGVAVAACPPGRARWLALPGAFVLAELARWSFPFGGVPLATLPQSQADGPLLALARVGSSLLLVAVVVIIGIALSAAWQRAWRPVGVAAAIVVGLAGLAVLAPRGEAFDRLDVAIVQGGGPQNTRASDTDEREVFEKHLAASELVETPVDVVLWPENVVNVEGALDENIEFDELSTLARQLDTTLIVGAVEGVTDTEFLNAAIAFGPDGEVVDRYDKVRTVPFGEFVPFRSLLEAVAGGAGLPERDARAGSGPGILETDEGTFGTLISWEVFFENRGRSAARAGSTLQLNPTNGASYWLTQVQTQQIASSRLRAVESGRWVLQAAPTGFSAILTPEGEVVERTAISEQAVLQGTVELRDGDTWATLVGIWPVFVLSLLSYPAAWWVQRRGEQRARSTVVVERDLRTSSD
jgi:apolipoprotein N-acyltransferase